jgi:hypothetical protein
MGDWEDWEDWVLDDPYNMTEHCAENAQSLEPLFRVLYCDQHFT